MLEVKDLDIIVDMKYLIQLLSFVFNKEDHITIMEEDSG